MCSDRRRKQLFSCHSRTQALYSSSRTRTYNNIIAHVQCTTVMLYYIDILLPSLQYRMMNVWTSFFVFESRRPIIIIIIIIVVVVAIVEDRIVRSVG